MAKEMRAALYLRVSTGEQTVDNQRHELEAIAAARGWRVVATYADEGIYREPKDAKAGQGSTWR